MTGDVGEGLNETRQEAPGGELGAEVGEMAGGEEKKMSPINERTHLNEVSRSVSTNGPITTGARPGPDGCSHAFKSWRIRTKIRVM